MPARNSEDDRFRMLDRCMLFHGLPVPLLQHVLGHASEHLLREGEALFFKNDVSDFLVVVLEGQIHEVLYGPDGQELIIATPGAGETVDEAALFDGRSRSFTAIACATTRVLKLPRRHFPILMSMPGMLERVNSLLCLRLRQSIDRLENICLHRLESRLARYLLVRIGAQGQEHDAAAEIALPATQSVLAAMLNVSRPRLNVQLQAWQRSGLTTRRGNRLRIHDIAQLRRKAYASSDAAMCRR
ncbi:MAG: Crp/Fnr family transcriptional regulator [Luteimonas sp.]